MAVSDLLLASCAALLVLHFTAYYVFTAVNAPRFISGHETTLTVITTERRECVYHD